MSNLLDKASIILTPTAYNNGTTLCVKPSDGSGDFDFSRNSAATRVNAQGLVENVQILSSNLVQNGDFSDGTTGWSNPTYSGNNSASLSIDNGALKIEKNADLDWRSSFVSQTPITYVSGKTYKITYSLKDGTTSGADVYVRTNFDRSANTVNVKALTNDWVEYTDYYVADTSADDISFGVLAWQNTGSGQYYFIDNVSIIEITTDTSLPRINYEGFSYDGSGNVVPDSGCGSWMWEPQSTNLITQSEDFSDASWSKISCVIGSEAVSSPSGVIGVSSVTNTSLFGRLSTIKNLNSGISYTYSFWAKNIDITTPLSIYLNNSGISLDTFTPTSEWVRYQFTWTSSSTITETIAIQDRIGTALGSYMIWGAQVEQQSYATSYIPTNGEANGVTRNQDLCNNGGSLASINSTEGVLYAEIAALSNNNTNRIISITDGASVNGVSLYYSSSSNVIRANYYVGGVEQCNLQYILADETDFSKIAFVWKINRFELWVDSIKRAEDLSGAVNIANTMNDLSFSRLGGNIFFGKTKALAVWKEALSDQELAELTTI